MINQEMDPSSSPNEAVGLKKVPYLAEKVQQVIDHFIDPPSEVRVERELHASLEFNIFQAALALQSGDWGSVSDHYSGARRIFGSTDLPRIAHLMVRPGSVEMVFRPKYRGRVEITTDYTRGKVVYRIIP